jgi:hypothetical protein
LTQTPLKNIAASVRQRLLDKSRSDMRPFQELAQYYAMERFLYRLSLSKHSKRFILKGALMLRIWKSPRIRPTMDIDMLGRTSNKVSDVVSNVIEILSIDVDPDGLTFFHEEITAEHITDDSEYQGIRIRFPAKLDTMTLNMQLDHVPAELEHIAMTLKEFIDPIASALASRKPPPSRWSAPGPWV